MAYANEYDAACSDCLASFKLPFTPSSGRPYYCPMCTIKQNDMCQSTYFKELIVFLSDKLGVERGIGGIRKPVGNIYEVLLEEKGSKEPKYLCTTTWMPKDPLRLFPDREPVAKAIVNIAAKDTNIEKIIKEFVKGHGIEAKVPTNKPNKSRRSF